MPQFAAWWGVWPGPNQCITCVISTHNCCDARKWMVSAFQIKENHNLLEKLKCESLLMAAAGPEKRDEHRVPFSRGIPVRIVAIDGTWSRDCQMIDASATGAKLALTQSVAGLRLKEFFLLSSTTGSSFRRCELAWINGDDMGVRFIEKPKSSKPKRSESD